MDTTADDLGERAACDPFLFTRGKWLRASDAGVNRMSAGLCDFHCTQDPSYCMPVRGIVSFRVVLATGISRFNCADCSSAEACTH